MIDESLNEGMETVLDIVVLGRSTRNASGLKNRQPLSKMLISEKAIPDYYGDIIKDELNIKTVVLGANLSKYVNFNIMPNLPVLGKTYVKLIPEIKKYISSQNQMELIPKIKEEIAKKNQMDLANTVKNGGVEYVEIDDTQIELNAENLLVTMQGIEGFAFAGTGTLGVVLDTTITEELKEEGYIRELISKIQNMRKDKEFEVLDRITLYVNGNKTLEDIIEKNKPEIKKETLTIEIVYNAERKQYTECNINGEKINIDVTKI